MWVITGIAALAGVCALLEIPSIKGDKKELWFFGSWLGLASAICVAAAVKAPLPNPLDWIAAGFLPIGEWMQSSFK